MDVKIKKFNVDMAVKSKGIEFEVRRPRGKGRLGDLYLTMSGLTWCEGQVTKKNGKTVKWEQFIDWMKTES